MSVCCQIVRMPLWREKETKKEYCVHFNVLSGGRGTVSTVALKQEGLHFLPVSGFSLLGYSIITVVVNVDVSL